MARADSAGHGAAAEVEPGARAGGRRYEGGGWVVGEARGGAATLWCIGSAEERAVVLDDGSDGAGEETLAFLHAAASVAEGGGQGVAAGQAAAQTAADSDRAGLGGEGTELGVGGRDGVEVGVGDVEPVPDLLQAGGVKVARDLMEHVEGGERLGALPGERNQPIVRGRRPSLDGLSHGGGGAPRPGGQRVKQRPRRRGYQGIGRKRFQPRGLISLMRQGAFWVEKVGAMSAPSAATSSARALSMRSASAQVAL